MKLKLARKLINSKPESVEISKLEEVLLTEGQKIFYFDKENSHKDLVGFVEYFESKEYNVYLREIKYGLNEGDFMYEVQIL